MTRYLASFVIKNNDRCEWSIQQSEECIYFLEKDQKLLVEFVEQPIPAGWMKKVPILKKYSPFPLFADESITHSSGFRYTQNTIRWRKRRSWKAGSYMNGIRLVTEARKNENNDRMYGGNNSSVFVQGWICAHWLIMLTSTVLVKKNLFSWFIIGWRIAFQYERTVMCMSVFLPLSSLAGNFLTTRDIGENRFSHSRQHFWKTSRFFWDTNRQLKHHSKQKHSNCNCPSPPFPDYSFIINKWSDQRGFTGKYTAAIWEGSEFLKTGYAPMYKMKWDRIQIWIQNRLYPVGGRQRYNMISFSSGGINWFYMFACFDGRYSGKNNQSLYDYIPKMGFFPIRYRPNENRVLQVEHTSHSVNCNQSCWTIEKCNGVAISAPLNSGTPTPLKFPTHSDRIIFIVSDTPCITSSIGSSGFPCDSWNVNWILLKYEGSSGRFTCDNISAIMYAGKEKSVE